MANAAGLAVADLPWIRNARFDLGFILGLMAVAAVTGSTILLVPQLFWPVLVLDLWFLGYHHVISTYTRICFDTKSFRDNGHLIYGLLPAVAAATSLVAWAFGIWVIVSVYFYWQWWHYTRQSWGISRAYRGKDRHMMYEDGWLDQAIFYALPVLGILTRSYQDHKTFIGLELWSIPVPYLVVQLAWVATLPLLAMWAWRRWTAWREGRLAVVHTLYMLSHFAIFSLGYLIIGDITIGWLVINIWHNAQYILFVWMFNSRRFKDGVDPNARFLSYISQPGRLWLYLLTCVAITGVVYIGVLGTMEWLFYAGLSATIVVYQIVNFHHYVVDSMIWKVRKPQIRETLGLN
jgi:hypothetical protein